MFRELCHLTVRGSDAPLCAVPKPVNSITVPKDRFDEALAGLRRCREADVMTACGVCVDRGQSILEAENEKAERLRKELDAVWWRNAEYLDAGYWDLVNDYLRSNR